MGRLRGPLLIVVVEPVSWAVYPFVNLGSSDRVSKSVSTHYLRNCFLSPKGKGSFAHLRNFFLPLDASFRPVAVVCTIQLCLAAAILRQVYLKAPKGRLQQNYHEDGQA